ncbi:MAG: phytanoyl-CoA dioxygenase family protein [Pseudomonadota bacterium]
MTGTLSNDSLSEDDRAAYARDGYLCPVDVMSKAEAATHRAMLERYEARHASGDVTLPMETFKRVNSHIVMREAAEIALDPRILDRVESILGPDILLWSCEFIVKEARTDKVIAWHQDLTYWGMGGSDHEVTAWVALSDASAAVGCMRFVPGSHRNAIVAHEDRDDPANLLSRGQELAVEVDEADAVTAALRPGQMSLHHGRIFHASGPNVTDDRRIGLVIRYITPETPSTGQGRDYAMLARGVDRYGRRSLMTPPAESFSAPALALYEEVRSAQAATLADGAEDVALYA